MDRLEVRAQVLDCTSCDLNVRCTAPVPFSGSTPCKIAVIGEAPGIEDDESGVPFSGPGGRLLARLMAEVGLDSDVCWMNAVSCVPLMEEGTRIPSAAELNACLPNLYVQLRAAAPACVILAGSVALHTFRPDLRVAKEHGRCFWTEDGLLMFSIYNPVAALRNPAWETELRADLSLLREILDDLDATSRTGGR